VDVAKQVRKTIALALVGAATALSGQNTKTIRPGATSETTQYQPQTEPAIDKPLSNYAQEIDSASAELGKIPADPLFQTDPFGIVTKTVDMGGSWLESGARLRFGATYTFLNQYATVIPDTAQRHDQVSGRLDFTGNWEVYEKGSTAGSIALLIRSGTNIGMSQQWNLSDQMGSGIYLNCLQGGGAQRPITVNVLYWRQDFMHKRLSFYVGKLHPNQFVSLSFLNNDERTQFLNGENDGNLAIASDGTYAGGGAVDFQMTHHFYMHALAIDTIGSQYTGIGTMGDNKFLEAIEFGWFAGAPGSKYLKLRATGWRDDTKTTGSGHGVAFGFDHEYANGWAPFGRYGFATETGTAIRQTDTLGITNLSPFGRRGDMFGAAFNYIQPTHTGKRHESLFETFYRIRMTKSMEIGPDVQVSIHPMYAAKAYTSVLLNARMRIIF
jgi:porin